jgi:hypothetical protein
MSINKENINNDNASASRISNKENNQNINPIKKNQIKVKLNPKINPVNKGLKLLDQNINYQDNPKEKSKKENKEEKIIKKNGLNRRNINLFQNKRESDSLLQNYGEESYFYNKLLDKTVYNIPETFLQNHKITSIVRTKMIDWMIEVCSVLDFMDETFFLSVNILDIFLQRTKKIYHNTDIHLIGLTSIFTSSKFQEIYPQSLINFSHKVGHDIFTIVEIKNMETKIMSDVGMEILVSTSIYDFMKTYFYDFFYNNKKVIEKNCDIKMYKDIVITAKYLTKLILHYEYFYLYENSMKAIGCIITAIKLMKYFLKDKFQEKDKIVYEHWTLFLMDQDGIDKKNMDNLVSKIYLAFNHYQKSKSISKNLNKFMKLPFADLIQQAKEKEMK